MVSRVPITRQIRQTTRTCYLPFPRPFLFPTSLFISHLCACVSSSSLSVSAYPLVCMNRVCVYAGACIRVFFLSLRAFRDSMNDLSHTQAAAQAYRSCIYGNPRAPCVVLTDTLNALHRFVCIGLIAAGPRNPPAAAIGVGGACLYPSPRS